MAAPEENIYNWNSAPEGVFLTQKIPKGPLKHKKFAYFFKDFAPDMRRI